MSRYVLIHGGWQASWVWCKVKPLLRRSGHTVAAPDLPGHGTDTTSHRDVSLDAYVGRVINLLESADEPAILVGHSMGGIINSQAAERAPSHVAALVFVGAFIPADGQSLRDIVGESPQAGGMVIPNLVPHADGISTVLREEAVKEALYEDSSEQEFAWIKSLMQPQPMRPFEERVSLSREKWGRVPRFYIELTRDKALPPFLQRQMHQEHSCQRVMTIDSDHSPFFSAPNALADALAAIASEVEGVR